MLLIWCWRRSKNFIHLWSPFWWGFGVKLLSWWDDPCIINNSRCSCHQHSVNTAAVLGKRLSLMMSGNKHNRYAHTRRNLRRTCTAAAHQQSKPRGAAWEIFKAAAGFISPPISPMSHGSCVMCVRSREWAEPPVCLRRQH